MTPAGDDGISSPGNICTEIVKVVSSVDHNRIGHVGIALGDGTWIQAVGTGIPVRVRPVPSAAKISAVRRIVTG